ncbi:glycosyltransferase involved in cell wall biosynthesis [Bacillus sp. SORGH_AS 510]|uniref:glycosyltransferase n=1 Tax=Bacillus sp. SORGH_AS_0510 TaxID=3041771 RepID=UPI0027829286|nr:glycosyltransferase [Bacillus sp. SORGH_AS_0510]MDQ1147905.1 glycosyltransferase involved in cell wall biosynthesis [Bacillus sp. SORGH_AS_0510]
MNGQQKPKMSLCMIVKNEEQFLPLCLDSVKSFIDEIIIVDTGSTDRTIQIAEQYGAIISEVPWEDDFSKARNMALEHATGDWILHLDADEQIEKQDIQQLLTIISSTQEEAFLLQVINHKDETPGDALIFPSVRLWRNRKEYRFRGALHEQISPSITNKNPSKPLVIIPIRIHHYGYSDKIVQEKKKSDRNLKIALAEVERYPKSSFAHFNLGTEFSRLKQHDQAIKEFRLSLDQLTGKHELWVPSLFRNLAGALVASGKNQEAIEILDKGLSSFPDFIDLLYWKAVCHYQLKEYPRAIGLFHQCLVTRENPQYAYQKGLNGEKSHFLLGHCYILLNRLDEGLYHYKKAYELNKLFKEPMKQLAAIYSKLASQ